MWNIHVDNVLVCRNTMSVYLNYRKAEVQYRLKKKTPYYTTCISTVAKWEIWFMENHVVTSTG